MSAIGFSPSTWQPCGQGGRGHGQVALGDGAVEDDVGPGFRQGPLQIGPDVRVRQAELRGALAGGGLVEVHQAGDPQAGVLARRAATPR